MPLEFDRFFDLAAHSVVFARLAVPHPARWTASRITPELGEVGEIKGVLHSSTYTRDAVYQINFERAGRWEKLPCEVDLYTTCAHCASVCSHEDEGYSTDENSNLWEFDMSR